jgi:hypothetical protein
MIPMIKWLSSTFVFFIILLFSLGLLVSFFSALKFLNPFINYSAIALLISGIFLIVALIVDRFKDSKSEGDDYKKY